jgi:hypothetical protein
MGVMSRIMGVMSRIMMVVMTMIMVMIPLVVIVICPISDIARKIMRIDVMMRRSFVPFSDDAKNGQNNQKNDKTYEKKHF